MSVIVFLLFHDCLENFRCFVPKCTVFSKVSQFLYKLRFHFWGDNFHMSSLHPMLCLTCPLLFYQFPKLSVVVPCFIIIMKFPFPMWMGSHWCSLLHYLPLVPALAFVPLDSLKDRTFYNLSSCNVLSMIAEFSE